MIELTRLNGSPMVLNSDLIKTAEASPDTMLTLINGEKLIVREEIAEVVERVLAYRARLLAVVARRLHNFGDLERVAAWPVLTLPASPPRLRSPYRKPAAHKNRRPHIAPHVSEEQYMDKASIGGAFLAIAGIVAGLLIEGGNLGQILQPTAALIVFGGTLGAVLLQFPLTTVVAAFRSLAHLFAAPRKHDTQLIRLLVAFANKARRNGVVSLDADLRPSRTHF